MTSWPRLRATLTAALFLAAGSPAQTPAPAPVPNPGSVPAGIPSAQAVHVVPGGEGVSPDQQSAVRSLAIRGLNRLAPMFPGTPIRPIRIVVHRNESTIAPGLADSLHPRVPGFARLQKDEIHLVMARIGVDPPNDTRTTVDHELVHILLDQFVGENGLFVPRWFHEGLAQDLAGGGSFDIHEEDLVYRVRARTYHPFHTLEKSFPKHSRDALSLAYGQSYSFVAFLHREIGLETLLAAARECGPELTFKSALAGRLRQALVTYEDRWLDYILYRSGAGFRVVLNNFFILMIVLAGPLLAIAVARRRNREESMKARLAQIDVREDAERVAALVAVQSATQAREELAPPYDGWHDPHDEDRPDYDEDSGEYDEDDEDEVDWDDWRDHPDAEQPR